MGVEIQHPSCIIFSIKAPNYCGFRAIAFPLLLLWVDEGSELFVRASVSLFWDRYQSV